MKNIIEHLNKVFESRVRLGIMSVLVVNESVNFNSLKELLDVSDGNLATHIKALEKNKYLNIKKEFINNKPNTSYSITTEGKNAFESHLTALEELLKVKR